MSDTIILNLEIHSFFALVLGVFLVIHAFLVALKDTKNFAYIKRLMLFLPAYYGVLAFIIFSGILALPLANFSFNLAIFVMIIASILLIILGAKGFKELKKVRILGDFAAFKKFMYKKIAAEMLLLFFAYLLGKFYAFSI